MKKSNTAIKERAGSGDYAELAVNEKSKLADTKERVDTDDWGDLEMTNNKSP